MKVSPYVGFTVVHSKGEKELNNSLFKLCLLNNVNVRHQQAVMCEAILYRP
jgi:hypothetical protein